MMYNFSTPENPAALLSTTGQVTGVCRSRWRQRFTGAACGDSCPEEGTYLRDRQ